MEKKDNEGVAFKNDKKTTDAHPVYKGSAMVAGTEYWVSFWLNKSKSGDTYMKYKFNEKEDARSKPSAPQQSPVNEEAFDDDIPF